MTNDPPTNLNCRFCRATKLLNDEPVAATRHHYILASMDPKMPMAVMIIPEKHHESPFSISADEWMDFQDALNAAKDYLARYKPDGYTLGWNVTPAAGQTVDHVHCHVIARHNKEPIRGIGIRKFLKVGWERPEFFKD